VSARQLLCDVRGDRCVGGGSGRGGVSRTGISAGSISLTMMSSARRRNRNNSPTNHHIIVTCGARLSMPVELSDV